MEAVTGGGERTPGLFSLHRQNAQLGRGEHQVSVLRTEATPAKYINPL